MKVAIFILSLCFPVCTFSQEAKIEVIPRDKTIHHPHLIKEISMKKSGLSEIKCTLFREPLELEHVIMSSPDLTRLNYKALEYCRDNIDATPWQTYDKFSRMYSTYRDTISTKFVCGYRANPGRPIQFFVSFYDFADLKEGDIEKCFETLIPKESPQKHEEKRQPLNLSKMPLS